MQHPDTLGDTEIVAHLAYVAYVAYERHVSRSAQMQALNALLLLYREVLVVPVGDLRHVLRWSSPTRLPSVLTREDVRAVVSRLDGTARAAVRVGASADGVLVPPGEGSRPCRWRDSRASRQGWQGSCNHVAGGDALGPTATAGACAVAPRQGS